jgi:predicted nucleic acid-binding protein
VILPDTSIWIDHLRKADKHLVELLATDQVASHAFVIGEIALGSIATRTKVIARLSALPPIRVATTDQVSVLIEHWHLWGTGIGYVDAYLLASARIANAKLWTRDKRLSEQAERLNVQYEPGL